MSASSHRRSEPAILRKAVTRKIEKKWIHPIWSTHSFREAGHKVDRYSTARLEQTGTG